MTHSTLNIIQIEQQKVVDRRREMLVTWLNGGSECTKVSLRTALRKIKCNVTDVQTTSELIISACMDRMMVQIYAACSSFNGFVALPLMPICIMQDSRVYSYYM